MSIQLLYALVNGIKTLPSQDVTGKSLHGKCPLCGGEVVAKCGNVRVHHWAHKSKTECETFSRDMSEWHKGWQDKFPLEWREKPIISPKTSKRHFADVCTNDNIIVEFQHSPISSEEQLEREEFYSLYGKGMVWVVDAHHQQALKRLEEELYFEPIKINDPVVKEYYLVDVETIENTFPIQWTKRNKFVFFDFYDTEKNTGNEFLYCVFPYSGKGKRFIFKYPREQFSQFISNINLYNCYLGIIPNALLNPTKPQRITIPTTLSPYIPTYAQIEKNIEIKKAMQRNNGYSKKRTYRKNYRKHR